MRHSIFSWATRLLLAASMVSAGTAFAQDDFDEEFEESSSSGEGESDDEESATEEPAAASSEGGDETEAAAAPATSSEEPAAAPATADARAERAMGFRSMNTIGGAVGGIHIVDAASAPAGTFRVQLATEFFFAKNFLNEGDTHSHIGGTLSLSYSILDFLEAFASITSTANSNDTETPPLFQTLGDATLGVKGFYRILPWLAVGGDATIAFLNSVGDIGVVGQGTSVGLRANASADFRRFETSFPLIARFNMQYYFDNSSNLTESAEQARYDALPSDRRDYIDENRHLLTRVERFALGVNRHDRLTFGLGVEAPLKVMENFFIHPLAEWRLSVPVNRQGYSCLYIPGEGVGSASGEDGCVDRQGVSTFPQTLTLGVRVLPPVSGLSAFASVDIGLTGVSTFARELAPTAPYNVMLGLSYAYDATPIPPDPVVREVERRVEVPAVLPVKGRVHTLIVEQGAPTTRVAGAIVRFPGREVSAQASATDGTFTTYEFDPGAVQLEISHPEYNTGTCSSTIPAEGGTVELTCELVALPRVGTLHGVVSNETGAPLGAVTVSISGPASRSFTTGASGAFDANDLPPGTYEVRLEGEGFFPKQGTFTIASRATSNPQFTLVERPRRSSVQVTRREIVIRKQINFATDSDTIDPSSNQLVLEIADVLQQHAEITGVEIQGHTDNVGNAERNMDLSQRRAESVRRALIEAGIDAGRLEAKGYGVTRPLVPNITARNRARNRRVQFIIQQ